MKKLFATFLIMILLAACGPVPAGTESVPPAASPSPVVTPPPTPSPSPTPRPDTPPPNNQALFDALMLADKESWGDRAFGMTMEEYLAICGEPEYMEEHVTFVPIGDRETDIRVWYSPSTYGYDFFSVSGGIYLSNYFALNDITVSPFYGLSPYDVMETYYIYPDVQMVEEKYSRFAYYLLYDEENGNRGRYFPDSDGMQKLEYEAVSTLDKLMGMDSGYLPVEVQCILSLSWSEDALVGASWEVDYSWSNEWDATPADNSYARSLAVPNKKKQMGLKDIVAGPLHYGMSEKETRKILGEPLYEGRASDSLRSYEYKFLAYPGGNYFMLQGYDDQFILERVILQDATFAGPRGICVGDSIEKVVSSFSVSPPADEIPPEYHDRASWDFNEYTVFYSTVFKLEGEDAEDFGSGESDPYYFLTSPEGYMYSGYDEKGELYHYIRYSVPFDEITLEDIQEWYVPYMPKAYVGFFCRDGVVKKIDWYTYAAE